MAKQNSSATRPARTEFLHAFETCEEFATWELDLATDLVRADAVVAHLFNVDPDTSSAGIPRPVFASALQAEDRGAS